MKEKFELVDDIILSCFKFSDIFDIFLRNNLTLHYE